MDVALPSILTTSLSVDSKKKVLNVEVEAESPTIPLR